MARKKSIQKALLPALSFDLHNPYLRQSAALAVVLLGALLSASLFGLVRTDPTDALPKWLRLLLGLGAYVAALAMMLAGFLSLRALIHQHLEVAWRRVVGAEVLFFSLLALAHMPFANARAVAERGEGGGMAGWAIGDLLASNLGRVPASALLVLFALLGAIWLLELDLMALGDWLRDRLPSFQAKSAAPSEPAAVKPERRKSAAPRDKAAEPVIPKVAAPKMSAAKRLRRDKRLPPLDIFRARSKMEIDNALMNERARIIEDTLSSFGIPSRVVDSQQGPTVTQFALEPGYVERRLPDGTTK